MMITFQQAIAQGFRNYANFGGRATRAAYWWWFLFVCLAKLAAGILNGTSGSELIRHANGLYTPYFATMSASNPLGRLVVLALLLPTLAYIVRRLRDADHGWGNVFWLLLPVIGWIILICLLLDRSRPAPVTTVRVDKHEDPEPPVTTAM